MFSAVPRCQGWPGSQKYNLDPGVDGEDSVLGELFSLVPGQGPAEVGGEVLNDLLKGGPHGRGRLVGEREQDGVARGAAGTTP